MAKKDQALTFTDIVLRAEADVIQQAYEARVKIDGYLEERAKAYEQIAALEEQVDSVLGETGVFPFPPPPLPVAGFGAKPTAATRSKPKKPAAPKPAPAEHPKDTDLSEADSSAPEEPGAAATDGFATDSDR